MGKNQASIKKILYLPSKREGAFPECRLRVGGIDAIEYGEEAFNRILALERKRSERSKRPFILMLLSLERVPAENNGDNPHEKILSCLACSKRDTDILGWYKTGSVIGIIFTEICNSCDKSLTEILRSRISSHLSLHMDPQIIKRIDVSVFFFPEELGAGVSKGQLAFYPDIALDRKAHRKTLFVKRILDIVGSLIALILSAPVFLLISALIKLTSKGPVLFRQTRVGRGGKTFTLLKFRTMFVNNDPSVHMDYTKSLIVAPEEGPGNGNDASGKAEVFKIRNDPRVAPVGGLLRKTSLDELPQLINVLMGDMSLVGPRPPIPYEVDFYDLWHMRRVLDMKPGITGMWQVMGRSRTTFNEMVRLDIYYCANWSIWLDLKLMLKTPLVVLGAKGAY